MARKSRIILGLNSGTSADGVDAVACEITGRGLAMKVRVIGHVQRPYSLELRRRLLTVMAPAATRTEEICRLETLVGTVFADAAETAKKKLGLRRIDLIGSHGQTICHLPPRTPGKGFRRVGGARTATRTNDGETNRAAPVWKRSLLDDKVPLPYGRDSDRNTNGTHQIGDPTIISLRLGVPVVSHFRQADMAVGGQGAPLVPWTDYVLFRHATKSRIIQNIGGIANLTWLPAGCGVDDVFAFDTGPGNMVIDALVRHFSKGQREYDADGRLAADGRISWRIMADLIKHPFVRLTPPKSCGREEFGEQYLMGLLRRYAARSLRPQDWAATLTRFTAECICLGALSMDALYPPALSLLQEVILCGGGAANPTMCRFVQETICEPFRRTKFSTTADYGIAIQAKEGVSFAMLAAACVDRIPANLPQVTGARRRVVLGQLCNPEPRS